MQGHLGTLQGNTAKWCNVQGEKEPYPGLLKKQTRQREFQRLTWPLNLSDSVTTSQEKSFCRLQLALQSGLVVSIFTLSMAFNFYGCKWSRPQFYVWWNLVQHDVLTPCLGTCSIPSVTQKCSLTACHLTIGLVQHCLTHECWQDHSINWYN